MGREMGRSRSWRAKLRRKVTARKLGGLREKSDFVASRFLVEGGSDLVPSSHFPLFSSSCFMVRAQH